MGYTIKQYPILEEAKSEAVNMDYVLLYYPGGISLIPADILSSDKWKNCMEARAFNKEAEIHFWMDDEDKMKAVKVSDSGNSGNTDTITREYHLARRFRESLKEQQLKKEHIRVKEYLDTDEDGQCHIVLTRLSELI